jgi:hypothetical protein
MKIETRNSLAELGCDSPHCTHDHSVLFMQPACHPNAGFVAIYEKASGILTMCCCVCETPMAAFLVADHTGAIH